MTRTGLTTTPAKGVKHDHDLIAQDAEDATLAARVTTLEQKVAALESPTPPPPTGTWFGLADPWAGIPFGSRPLAPSGALWAGAGQVIRNLTFRNRPAGQNVIVVENAGDVIIEDCDFDGVPECIYAFNAQRLIIRRCRVGGAGIFGPFTRTGFHSGNFAQVVNSSGVRGSDIQIIQPATVPAGSPVAATAWGTEDIISLGGAPGSWGDHIWERVQLVGGAWKSPSGTGFFVGDGASGHDVAILNAVFIDPGQCAIGTGEEGLYTLGQIDVKSSRLDTNAALQIRSNRTAIGNVRVDWAHGAAYSFGGTPVPATTFTDLGGNDWSADL